MIKPILQFNKNKIEDEIVKKIVINDNVEVEFKDEILLNGKKSKLKELAKNFTIIDSFFLDYLNAYNIHTGYLRTEDKKIIFNKHEVLPFQVKILNSVDARTSEIFEVIKGDILPHPVYEFYYGDNFSSLISESHLIAFNIIPIEDIKAVKRICSKLNVVLKSFFDRRNFKLAEVKCTFGRSDNKIFVTGDFTPTGIKIIFNEIDPYDLPTVNHFKTYINNILGLIK